MAIRLVRSVIVDAEGREKERVDGRESPGNEERRTFTGCEFIFGFMLDIIARCVVESK